MANLQDSLSLGKIVLKSKLFIHLEIDFTWSIEYEIMGPVCPVKLAQIEPERVIDLKFCLEDLLDQLLGI